MIGISSKPCVTCKLEHLGYVIRSHFTEVEIGCLVDKYVIYMEEKIQDLAFCPQLNIIGKTLQYMPPNRVISEKKHLISP